MKPLSKGLGRADGGCVIRLTCLKQTLEHGSVDQPMSMYGPGQPSGDFPPPSRCGRLVWKCLRINGLGCLPEAKVFHPKGLPLKMSFQRVYNVISAPVFMHIMLPAPKLFIPESLRLNLSIQSTYMAIRPDSSQP